MLSEELTQVDCIDACTCDCKLVYISLANTLAVFDISYYMCVMHMWQTSCLLHAWARQRESASSCYQYCVVISVVKIGDKSCYCVQARSILSDCKWSHTITLRSNEALGSLILCLGG